MPIPRLKKLISLLLILTVVVCPGSWGAIKFNGDADGVNAGDRGGYSVTGFTACGWYLIDGDDFNAAAKLLLSDSQANCNSNNGFFLALDDRNGANQAENGILFCVDTVTNQADQGYIDNIFTTEPIWYHICLAYTSNESEVYINGIKQAHTNTGLDGSGNFIPSTTDILGIGGDLAGFYSNQTISEIAIWSPAITEAQISFLAQSKVFGTPLHINPSTLVLYTRLDNIPDGSPINGVSVQDLTPQNAVAMSGVDADGDSSGKAETNLSYPGDE